MHKCLVKGLAVQLLLCTLCSMSCLCKLSVRSLAQLLLVKHHGTIHAVVNLRSAQNTFLILILFLAFHCALHSDYCLPFPWPLASHHFLLQFTQHASACVCNSTQKAPSQHLSTWVCLLLLSLHSLRSCLDKQSGVCCSVQALRSLVSNEAVQLEPYLHQIMPFILTCMVGKRLGVSFLGAQN